MKNVFKPAKIWSKLTVSSALVGAFSVNADTVGKASETVTSNFLSVGNMFLAAFGLGAIFFVGKGIWGFVKDRQSGGNPADNWKSIGVGIGLSLVTWVINIGTASVSGASVDETQQKQIIQGKKYG